MAVSCPECDNGRRHLVQKKCISNRKGKRIADEGRGGSLLRKPGKLSRNAFSEHMKSSNIIEYRLESTKNANTIKHTK